MGGQNKSGYALDTCTQINTWKNPNVGNFLSWNSDMRNSTLYIPEITIYESQRKGFDTIEILSSIKKSFSTKVKISPITISMHLMAGQLENRCPLLHPGDSAILAFCIETHTTLVTYDKALIESCKIIGVPVINLQQIPMEVIS